MIDSNFATFVSVEIINPSPKVGFSLNLSEKAMKKYNYFTDNKDLLNEYDKREAYLFYQASLMRGSRKDGFEEGIKEGVEKGRHAEQISMAIAMKKDGEKL